MYTYKPYVNITTQLIKKGRFQRTGYPKLRKQEARKQPRSDDNSDKHDDDNSSNNNNNNDNDSNSNTSNDKQVMSMIIRGAIDIIRHGCTNLPEAIPTRTL